MVALCCSAGMAQTDKPSEEDYLDFLYQYMPLPDKADYPRDFYRENVQLSLQARQEMPWGKTIPEREFQHFVLPSVREQREPGHEPPRVLPGAEAASEESPAKRCHSGGEPLVSREGDLSPQRRQDEFTFGLDEDSLRPLRRGIDISRGSPSVGGHSCPTGLYAALGTYRRQPCLGGSLGGRHDGTSSVPVNPSPC